MKKIILIVFIINFDLSYSQMRRITHQVPVQLQHNYQNNILYGYQNNHNQGDYSMNDRAIILTRENMAIVSHGYELPKKRRFNFVIKNCKY